MSVATTSEIPARQFKLLQVLAGWPEGQIPMVRDIAREMNLASESGVRMLMNPLIEKGLVERKRLGNGNPAPPYLTPAGRAALGENAITSNVGEITQIVEPDERHPLRQFAFIHAGECGPGIETGFEAASLESTLGVVPDEDYSFPVVGECMVPVFRPRDQLVMRPTERPLADSIVHVDVRISEDHFEPLLRQVVSNEGSVVVLKHFYPEPREVRLARADVWFRGRFVGFWRDETSILEQIREIDS